MPKTTHAMGELEILVDGESLYSYKRAGRLIPDPELVALVDSRLKR